MGGKAFDDVGAIHINEVSPTLVKISLDTGLNVKVLGSTGKRLYSGDIDIATEPKDINEFISKLQYVYGKEGVKKIGPIVTTRVPIEMYSSEFNEHNPRTGFVQVDYMFGDVDWLQLYYHSPRESESKLKGTHRNIAIAAITGYVDREASEEVDDQERPISLVRWKWSPKAGLVKVKRTSRKNMRTGGWIKKQDEEILSDEVRDPEQIVKILFKGKVGAESLNSAESLVDAVKVSYDADIAKEIFRQIARNFKDHADVGKKDWEFPNEIQEYIDEINGIRINKHVVRE